MIVKINLRNGYYYCGLVLDEDDNFITLQDIKNKKISINKKDIVTKEEVFE